MYIKNIFNVINYKGLPDGYKVEFDNITYIVGDNAKNKTTLLSVPLWILTKYNMYGSNKESVSNDFNKDMDTTASMTIIDNNGSEHIITRCSGKENYVTLDDVRTTKEILASKFFKDIHAFICAYNPTYFRSLKLAEQRELLLRILPAISAQEAFNLLNEEEKEIIKEPIADVKGYCKRKRSDIKELKSDLDRISGSRNVYINMVLQKEDDLREFSKASELEAMKQEYERLILDADNYIPLEDLENDIKNISEKINNNVKVDLQDLKEKHKKEVDNLNNVESINSKCPTCHQEIKNENLSKALAISYRRNINSLQDKINELKKETMEYMEKRKMQIEKYNKLKTPEMQSKAKRINEIKEKIDILRKEKTEIDLYNKEINIKHNQIIEAKKKMELLENEKDSTIKEIELYNNQLKVAIRLYSLMIEKQMKSVKRYLENVTIEFNRIDETTGEIIDDYLVRYDGREYEKLSKSYKLRADIEIAKMINKVTNINTFMVIDDVESITQINFDNSIQTILSIVIKHNELEVLYSYPEVLLRQKNSIDKTIQENEELLLNVA